MPRLTDQGLQRINDLAQHYGMSADAVMTLLQALLNSRGTMAQFDHRELGGAGQWMPGGMTMVGDMFNHGLKAKVDGLCSELSQILAGQPFVPFAAGFQSQSQSQGDGQQEGGHDVLDTGSASLFVPETPGRASGQWWPAELGFPSGTGAQNQIRYAYFNQNRRLAVELNGRVTIYDTLDHQISGVSQQQGRGGSLTLTSQRGTIIVSTLPVVSMDGVQAETSEPRMAPVSEPYRPDSAHETDLFAKIERLAELHNKGIVSSEEFAAKKAELSPGCERASIGSGWLQCGSIIARLATTISSLASARRFTADCRFWGIPSRSGGGWQAAYSPRHRAGRLPRGRGRQRIH